MQFQTSCDINFKTICQVSYKGVIYKICMYMFLFYEHNAYNHYTGSFSGKKLSICQAYPEPEILPCFEILPKSSTFKDFYVYGGLTIFSDQNILGLFKSRDMY